MLEPLLPQQISKYGTADDFSRANIQIEMQIEEEGKKGL